jgi:hypothetical protein
VSIRRPAYDDIADHEDFSMPIRTQMREICRDPNAQELRLLVELAHDRSFNENYFGIHGRTILYSCRDHGWLYLHPGNYGHKSTIGSPRRWMLTYKGRDALRRNV